MISFHSDDYGYSKKSDKKILSLAEAGKLRSISVLSTMASDEALGKLSQLLKFQKNIKIALHINLTERKLIKFVFDLLSGKVGRDEIRNEVERQFKALISAGITPIILDSHQHIHALSPVAEVVVEVAQNYGVRNIRSYKNIRRYTLTSKLKYIFLKIIAFISYFMTYRKIGFPITWILTGRKIAVMSWEGKSFNIASDFHKDTVYIIHPDLKFDKNLSYLPVVSNSR